jgi:hypothetical protein
MENKCLLAEKLTKAYKAKDKETLSHLARNVLPTLLSSLEDVHKYHNLHKDKYLRPFGIENTDHMYGGQKERVKYAIRRLEAFLDGKVPALEELEEERLPFPEKTWGCGYYKTPYPWG